jgi:hypothetical protein
MRKIEEREIHKKQKQKQALIQYPDRDRQRHLECNAKCFLTIYKQVY